MRSKDYTEKISRPNSQWKVVQITSMVAFIYKRDYIIGDETDQIPEIISNSHSKINFPNTDGKCIFYCIAYHKHGKKRDPRNYTGIAKEAFKEYCQSKNIEYSLQLFKNFKGVDIYNFDELEKIFKLKIEVYEMILRLDKYHELEIQMLSMMTQ